MFSCNSLVNASELHDNIKEMLYLVMYCFLIAVWSNINAHLRLFRSTWNPYLLFYFYNNNGVVLSKIKYFFNTSTWKYSINIFMEFWSGFRLQENVEEIFYGSFLIFILYFCDCFLRKCIFFITLQNSSK